MSTLAHFNSPLYLLVVPLLGLLLVVLDNPLILAAQAGQDAAQLRLVDARVHLHVHLVSGDARPHLLQFLRPAGASKKHSFGFKFSSPVNPEFKDVVSCLYVYF